MRITISSFLRFVLGGIFVVAGCTKAVDIQGVITVLTFDGFSPAWATIFSWLVMLFEVSIGTLLLFALATRWAAYVSVGMLLIFSGQLFFLLFSENAPSCACPSLMQEFNSTRNEHIAGLVRNGLLCSAGIFLIIRPYSKLNQLRIA